MSKYFSKGGATLYLLENAEAGNIASVCPITEQELTYLQAEYEEDHTATIHGMTVNDLTPELAKQYGYISDTQGVIVTQVDTGSSAAKSDFCPGFIILAYNNIKVKNLRELKMAIENAADKGSLLLLCRHGDLTRFYTLTLNQ